MKSEKEKFVIKKSEDKQFLWKVITPKQKEVYFGNPRVKNYTMSKDTKEKYDYIRSKPKYWEDEDMETGDFWERWILFNKPNLKKSVEDTCKRFDINIDYPTQKKYLTAPKGFKSLCEKADNVLVQDLIF